MSSSIATRIWGLGLIRYSSSYLHRLRYKNRKQKLSPVTTTIVYNTGIFKSFNEKRGSSSGSFKRNNFITNYNKSFSQKINVIDQKRTIDANKFNHRNTKTFVNKENLIQIQPAKNHYSYPVILYNNIRSLIKNFDEFQITIQQQKPDVAALSETWLTEDNSDNVEIPGYRAFHKIRQRPDKHHGGGVSIYLKNDLSILDTRFPTDNNLESISVTFRPSLLPRHIPFFSVTVIYSPPNDIHGKAIIDHTVDEIDRIFAINPQANTFVIGDFNDVNDTNLQRIKSLKQIIIDPTRGQNVLDKCYTNIKYANLVRTLPPIGNSDHNVVIINPSQSGPPQSTKKTITTRVKNKSCFLSMGKILSEMNWSIWNDVEDVNTAANIFHSFIRELYQICFPTKQKNINTNNKKWMNHRIITMMKERKKLFDNKKTEECKTINHKIKNAIKE